MAQDPSVETDMAPEDGQGGIAVGSPSGEHTTSSVEPSEQCTGSFGSRHSAPARYATDDSLAHAGRRAVGESALAGRVNGVSVIVLPSLLLPQAAGVAASTTELCSSAGNAECFCTSQPAFPAVANYHRAKRTSQAWGPPPGNARHQLHRRKHAPRGSSPCSCKCWLKPCSPALCRRTLEAAAPALPATPALICVPAPCSGEEQTMLPTAHACQDES